MASREIRKLTLEGNISPNHLSMRDVPSGSVSYMITQVPKPVEVPPSRPSNVDTPSTPQQVSLRVFPSPGIVTPHGSHGSSPSIQMPIQYFPFTGGPWPANMWQNPIYNNFSRTKTVPISVSSDQQEQQRSFMPTTLASRDTNFKSAAIPLPSVLSRGDIAVSNPKPYRNQVPAMDTNASSVSQKRMIGHPHLVYSQHQGCVSGDNADASSVVAESNVEDEEAIHHERDEEDEKRSIPAETPDGGDREQNEPRSSSSGSLTVIVSSPESQSQPQPHIFDID